MLLAIVPELKAAWFNSTVMSSIPPVEHLYPQVALSGRDSGRQMQEETGILPMAMPMMALSINVQAQMLGRFTMYLIHIPIHYKEGVPRHQQLPPRLYRLLLLLQYQVTPPLQSYPP